MFTLGHITKGVRARPGERGSTRAGVEEATRVYSSRSARELKERPMVVRRVVVGRKCSPLAPCLCCVLYCGHPVDELSGVVVNTGPYYNQVVGQNKNGPSSGFASVSLTTCRSTSC